MSSTPPPLRTNETIPDPVEPQTERYMKCDFCQCGLTRRGEVYSMSDKARDFRDEKERNSKESAKSAEDISALRSTIAEKDAEIAALKKQLEAPQIKAKMF